MTLLAASWTRAPGFCVCSRPPDSPPGSLPHPLPSMEFMCPRVPQGRCHSYENNSHARTRGQAPMGSGFWPKMQRRR